MEGPNVLRKLRQLPDEAPGVAGGLAGPLDEDGHLPTDQIPYVAITDTFTVSDQTERLALSAQKGDVAIQADNNTAYILQALPASTNGNWVALPQQPYSTSTHGGSGNAGRLLALDSQGKADGRDLQADLQALSIFPALPRYRGIGRREDAEAGGAHLSASLLALRRRP